MKNDILEFELIQKTTKSRYLPIPKDFKINTTSLETIDIDSFVKDKEDKIQKEKEIYKKSYWKRMRDPFSRERRVLWNFIIMIFTIYNCVVVPLRLCFGNAWKKDRTVYILLAFDIVGDIFFLLDIVLRFHTSYYQDGFMVKNRKLIAINYLKTWFVIDLISSLSFPLSMIDPLSYKHSLFRIFIFLRLFHFSEIFQVWRHNTIRFVSWLRLTQLIVMLGLVVHWITCIYLFLAYEEKWPGNSFSIPLNYRNSSLFLQYSYAVDYGIRFVLRVGGSVPPPVTFLEKAVVNLQAPIIIFLSALIIGSVVSLMNQFDPEKQLFDTKIQRLNNFSQRKKLTKPLTRRLRKFISREYSKGTVSDEKTILEMFPHKLKIDIISQIHFGLTEKIPLINSDFNFKDKILPFLQREIFEAGDFVIQHGDVSSEVFFIIKGDLAIKDEYGINTYQVVNEGNFFGEEILLDKGDNISKRKYSVEALSPTEVFFITKKAFVDVLKNFKKIENYVISIAKTRLIKRNIKDLLKSAETFPERQCNSFVEKFRDVKIYDQDKLIKKLSDTITSCYFIVDGEVLIQRKDENMATTLQGPFTIFGNTTISKSGVKETEVFAKKDLILMEIDFQSLSELYQDTSFENNIWEAFVKICELQKKQETFETSMKLSKYNEESIKALKEFDGVMNMIENNLKTFTLEQLIQIQKRAQNMTKNTFELIEYHTQTK